MPAMGAVALDSLAVSGHLPCPWSSLPLPRAECGQRPGSAVYFPAEGLGTGHLASLTLVACPLITPTLEAGVAPAQVES